MLSPYQFEAARPFLRLAKEIWETKLLVAWSVVCIWYFFPGSFHGVWYAVVEMPAVPFFPADTRTALFFTGAQSLQCLLIWAMWRRFRTLRSTLPAPWSKIDLDYIMQAFPALSNTPLRGLYFVYARFGSTRRQSARATPWHFRNTLYLLFGTVFLLAWVKFTGYNGLLMACQYGVALEILGLLVGQVQAVFGNYHGTVLPKLDYRSKPRYALAVLAQVIVCCIFWIVPSRGMDGTLYVLMGIPVACVGTLLSYLENAHHGDYVNSTGTMISSSSGAMFCHVCETTILARSAARIDQGNQHHPTIKSLRISAQSGCRICTAVWQSATHIPKDVSKILMFWKPATTQETSYSGFTVELNGGSVQFELRPRIGSDISLHQARQWLLNCSIFHGVCCANRNEMFRPSRLLLVDQYSVCVQVIKDMPSKVHYLTLSHCWGIAEKRPLRLLECNIDEFRQGIPWARLPKTFQDAIHITRYLRYSYLWIDSLCIVQDSPADWKYEAALMGRIYQNSACNIAASDAPDSTHGCLYPRNPCTLQPKVMHRGSEDERYLINRTDVYDQHVIYSRAWVLQEALLARRTLDCGRGQLFWRCGEMRASEVFPGGVPTNIYHDDHPASRFKAISADNDQVILNANVLIHRLRTKQHHIHSEPGRTSLERFTDSPFAFWAAIVRDYTTMHLTYEKDRIVAFDGIVNIFRPFFGEYWFGLWRIFMPAGLLWAATGSSRPPLEPRAPSWSWLSVEGPVAPFMASFTHGRDVLLTKILGAEEPDEDGQGTKLRFSTMLLRARCSGSEIDEIEGTKKWLKFPLFQDDYGRLEFDRPEEQLETDDIVLMCILVEKKRKETVLAGLVLEEVEDAVFRRIGCFTDPQKLILPFLKTVGKREILLV